MRENLEKVFEAFNIRASIADILIGPSVILAKVELALGQEFSKLQRIEKNIAAATKSMNCRVFGPISGTPYFGIELGKSKRDLIKFSDISTQSITGEIPIILGKDNYGENLIADLTSMPHLLIAGATGSGKSVCLNAIIQSIFQFSETTQLILIDPKKVEFAEYDGHPSVYHKATEPDEAIRTLQAVVEFMDRRYSVFAESGAKNIIEYNKKTSSHEPYYVVVIDELADLMMVSKGEVEKHIIRIAQLARAAGIHLVVGTQRPTTNVVTGLIKSNIPARIAFQVTSKMDSRIILDESGAEVLLGKGDGLFYDGKGKKVRFQGCFV